MAAIVIVPGLGVRSYAEPAVAALRRAGHDVDLRPAPAWRGGSADLRGYGLALAADLRHRASPVELLVGLSVGTQAAAVAAAATPVERLLLVSPTVAPEQRGRLRLFAAWSHGEDHPDAPALHRQARDWLRAGVPRLYRGFVSAIETQLEELLPLVDARVTVVHGDADQLSPHAYAAALAERTGRTLLEMPDAPHSWPIGDEQRFVGVVDRLLAEPAPDRP